MTFIIFIIVICVFILFNNLATLKGETKLLKSILDRINKENKELIKEITNIKKRLEVEPVSIDSVDQLSEETNVIPEPIKEIEITDSTLTFKAITDIVVDKPIILQENPPLEMIIKTDTNLTTEKQILPRSEKKIPKIEFIKEEPKESAFSLFLKKAEKQFADNWTGILGTAIMVLGIGYLSIYTAMKVSPLFRVLILWLYATLLIGSYYLLKKKEKWTKTGLWLRSAGASLFLFGCFGASQISALAFISNYWAGYSLIGVGIVLNLYVGYIIKKQTFLSLHVILSILILCVIPEKLLITFILAAITSTIGIMLSYKEKWEYHLLIVIVSFIIFDIWFNTDGTTLTTTQNILAIPGIIMVAGSCLFMQYRSVYENTRFEKSAFITHLTNWILFATGLILHSTGSRFKTFILFIGAIICFWIAQQARKKKTYWLYHLDGMVSFILCALSIIMLNDWNVGVDVIACVLYLLTAVCLFVVYSQKEILLYKIFLGINHFMAIALIVFLALMTSDSLEPSKITNATVSTIILFLISLSIPVFSAIKENFLAVDSFIIEKNFSLNGLLSIVFSVFVFLSWNNTYGNSFYYTVIIIALIWCFINKKFNTKTFEVGRVFLLVSSILIGIFIIKIQEKSYSDWVFVLGLFTVITFNWTIKRFYNNEFIIRFLCIVGINGVLIVLTNKYLSHYHIIHIFILFGIALANHEFLWINFKKKNLVSENETLLYILYYLFIFIGSALLLANSFKLTNTEIGLTCLGISAIEIYVLFAKRIRNKSEETIAHWKTFNLLNSEFLVFNFLLFGFSCFKTEYMTLFLSVLAVITFLGFQKFDEFKRYKNYSFIILIGSVVFSILMAIDNIHSADKTLLYITQTASILVSIGYFYLLTRDKKEGDKNFINLLPYIQNFWLIILLFIEVKASYLPILLMALALLNFWLIICNKIKIYFQFSLIVGLLAIMVSVVYSLVNINGFNATDWLLQLGSVALGIALAILTTKKEKVESLKYNYQVVLNIWLSIIMFSQLEHKWLPVFWASTAIINLFLYHKKISIQKNISTAYFLLANLHLGFLSFNFYESKFLAVYLLIFALLAVYIYLAYEWMEEFKLKNSLLVYPATLSIALFLYLTFDKGVLTFFWILEALGLLILGILLKEKYFRYVSLSLVGICIVRLMFFDLSNANFLIRALVLLGVGVVLLVMNSLFKKYKDRFD